jgi:PIN domain nuclease of toxin-antitoxin system
VNLLLDTHTFLWFINGDKKLSEAARTSIENIENERFLSIASVWEMAIKLSLGKLQFAQPFHLFIPQQMTRNRVRFLETRVEHFTLVAELPFHHKDPFDRLIIAQSLVEHIPIISIDEIFDAYTVARLW